MYINKQFKQTNDSNSNIESDPHNINSIKLRITSSKNFNNINYTLLPRLNESEKASKRNRENLEEKTNTDYKEELLVITTLWDELGITEDYRYQFNKILKHNIYDSKMLFFQEKENLQKFKTSLMKLKKEIYNRENNIENLIKVVKMIDAQKIENKVLLKEVVNLIKNLRLNAVNIVIYINRVRELGFYYYFQGKWDLTKLKEEYMYNNNYLLQMNEDLNFLKDSTLGKYLYLGEKKIDAFFTNCSQLNQEIINDDDKIIIPFSDDLIQLIEQSLYYVIQDKIMDNIYQKKSLSINRNNNINGLHRSNSTKIKIKKVPSRPMTSKGIFNSNKYRDIGLRSTIKNNNNNIFNGLETKLSNTFKNVEYNNLFQLSSKLNEPKINLIPESTRIKNRVRNPDCFKTFNNSDQKKIKIEHEIMSSLNSSNGKNMTYYEKNRNDSSEKIMIENEKLKKDNQEIKNELEKLSRKIEENEKFKKKLEDKLILQKKEMDYNSNSVEEIKIQLLKEKKEIEQKLKEEIEKSMNLKRQNENQIINKEIQFQIDKSKLINNIKYVNIYKKHNFQKNKIKNKYKIVYYKEDIDSLINKLKLSKIIENTQSQLNQYFGIENKIYNKEAYLIGQYPKVLITKLNEDDNQIIGVCTYYFSHNPIEQGILNINFICVIKEKEKENSLEQINDIIKFIKENENYYKIIITLNFVNNNNDNDLINYLKSNLGFKVDIIDNKIQLFFINNKENIKDIKGFLCSNTISLLSFTKDVNKSSAIINNDYKYANNLLIDALLLEQKKIFVDFNKKNERYKIISNLEKNYNPIINLILPENKNVEELNSKINDSNIKNKIKDSLCFKNSSNTESFGLIRLNLNLFVKNILYLQYQNYYYHRISCGNVEVIRDIKNACVSYNIPTLKEDINILILELNDSIKKILINNNSNIYDSFFDYYKSLNEKNPGKIVNILIPFFKIEKHLQTSNISNNLKNINIYEDANKNKVLNIGSFDEYIEVEFNKEEEININEQINYIVDNKDIIINQEFIFGIIYNKNTFVQLIHVQKDDWIEVTDFNK